MDKKHKDRSIVVAALLLVCMGLRAQDAAQFADRMEQAPAEERARILKAEGSPETLRAVFQILASKAANHSSETQYDQAVSASRIALEIADTLKDPKLKIAAYRSIAEALRAGSKNAESLETSRLGEGVAVEIGDKSSQAYFHQIGGWNLRALSRLREARDEGEESVRLFQEANDQEGAARAMINLSATLKDMGQWEQVVKYCERAAQLGESLHSQAVLVAALKMLSDVYMAQHDFALSLSYLERIPRPPPANARDWRDAGTLDSRLGALYMQLNRPEAQQVLERGLREAREGNDAGNQAWILARLGQLNEDKQPEIALDGYRQAAEIYRQLGSPIQEVSALEFLARLHTHLNEPQKAAEAAERAVTQARKAGTPIFLGGALDELGRAYRDLGRRKEAEQAFQESVKWTEVQRAEISGGQTNGASFLNGRESPYSSLMDLRAGDGDALEAIRLSEQVRARWLLDAMAEGKVDPQQGLSPEEKQKEQSLAREAARWNAQLSLPNPPAGAKDAFDKAARDLDSYRSDLYTRHAHLKARQAEPEVLTATSLQALVPDAGSLLIEYAFSERGSWIFTISRGSGTSAVVNATPLRVKQEELAARVEKFRNALATRDLSYKAQARQLYIDLLDPIQTELKGRTIVGIVPDGVLWNLPFQALQSDDGQYLIEHAALYYGPSFTSLKETATAPASNFKLKPLLAFGAGSNELPHASEEVHALAQFYGPTAITLTGDQASEERWKQDAQSARVLHVATHGVLNHANPMFSFVQLAKSGAEDGMLEAREILNTNLHAELMVLSACETGRGELIGGEGLVGMSWAAMTAGIPTVVVSQWKVDSASTTQLMVAFHRGIAREAMRPGPIRGKAEALRRAEIELIHTAGYQHPFYWAGFDMLGNGY